MTVIIWHIQYIFHFLMLTTFASPKSYYNWDFRYVISTKLKNNKNLPETFRKICLCVQFFLVYIQIFSNLNLATLCVILILPTYICNTKYDSYIKSDPYFLFKIKLIILPQKI